MTEIKKNSRKKSDLTKLVLSIAIIVLCNYLGSFAFHRFDLTSEKRYTLSQASKNVARDLKGTAFFKVYLGGKLTEPGFVRLRDAIKEILDEYKAYSDNKVEYEFIDPSSINPSDPKAVYRQLYEAGLEPYFSQTKDQSATSEQVIWPGAIVTYKGRDMAINAFQTQYDASPEAQLNSSVEALEYNIDNAIHKIDLKSKPVVAILQGHGEPDSLHLAGAIKALSEYYDVRLLPINHYLNGLSICQALIVAKPTEPIDDKDAYVIDQFIMRGGKVLWLLDELYTPMDSLKRNGITMAFPAQLNLDDQLFRYGVRINNNVIMDMQSSGIPLNTAAPGEQPRFQIFPWVFEPLISNNNSENPIVRNLNMIEFNVASTLDTIAQPGIKKTILLRTSKFTRLLNAPARISVDMARMQPEAKLFNQPYQPVAVMLEGKFTSAFKDRITLSPDTLKLLGYKPDGVKTSMIVVSDGDVIINNVKHSEKFAYPLGYDIYTNQQFGNKDFIVNCMNYLCGDSALLTVRTKHLQLRLLDTAKAQNYKTQWQMINMLIPIGLIMLLGLVIAVVRRQKYAS